VPEVREVKMHVVTDGEEVTPVMKGYRMACCDCGLVHTVAFTVIRKTYDSDGDSYTWKPVEDKRYGLMLTARRNNRSTGQMRRYRK
jgi:hypothetical protein